MNDLKYFKDRICSIFTVPTNRDFKQESPKTYPNSIYEYFMGVVEDIDQDGLWLRRIQSNIRTYFRMEHIVSIAEEEVLDPDKEEDAKVIDQFKSTKIQAKMNEGPFIDSEGMTDLSKEISKTLGAQK